MTKFGSKIGTAFGSKFGTKIVFFSFLRLEKQKNTEKQGANILRLGGLPLCLGIFIGGCSVDQHG